MFSAKPHRKTPPGEEQRPSVIPCKESVSGTVILQRQHAHPPQGPRVQEEGARAVLHHDSLEHSQPDGPFSLRAPCGRDQHPRAHQLQQPLCDQPARGESRRPSQLCRAGREEIPGIRAPWSWASDLHHVTSNV